MICKSFLTYIQVFFEHSTSFSQSFFAPVPTFIGEYYVLYTVCVHIHVYNFCSFYIMTTFCRENMQEVMLNY